LTRDVIAIVKGACVIPDIPDPDIPDDGDMAHRCGNLLATFE
jgi:hypothetical protein